MAEQQRNTALPKKIFVPGSLIGVYPVETPPPPDSTPLPAEAVLSTDENFDCKTRIGVLESEEKFPGPVHSWHAHHYFDNQDPAEVREAMELRFRAIQTFPQISVNLIRRHAPEFDGFKKTAPVGQFELELNTPAQLAAYLPWVVANHGNLRVLLHPNSTDDQGALRIMKDHSTDCFWLGPKKEEQNLIAEKVVDTFTKFIGKGTINPASMGRGQPANLAEKAARSRL